MIKQMKNYDKIKDKKDFEEFPLIFLYKNKK